MTRGEFVEQREKAMTNLEYYFTDFDDGVWNTDENENVYKWNIAIEVPRSVKLVSYDEKIKWLLSPHEKLNKLTQFEYDLLKCYCEPLLKINDIWILAKMKSKGYFKDVPHNASIKDILDNCEVIEDD